jgi:hypothetical protein
MRELTTYNKKEGACMASAGKGGLCLQCFATHLILSPAVTGDSLL